MPKTNNKFKNSKKIAATALVAGLVLNGGPIYANEVDDSKKEIKTESVQSVENNQDAKVEAEKVQVKEEQDNIENKEVEAKVEKEEFPKVEKNIKADETTTKEENKDTKVNIENKDCDQESKEVEQNNKTKEVKKEEETQNQDRQELEYAIEEMREAIRILDTEDLTKDENYERMLAFYKPALQRIETIKETKENKDYIQSIKDFGNEIEDKLQYIDGVRYEMNRVDTVFNPERKDILKNKQIVLDSLGNAADDGRYKVNSTTLNTAMKTYHNRYSEWNKELNESEEQLRYAIEETREVVNCKDNKDLTVKENLERKLAFMEAATQRLEGLYVLEGIENYSEHMSNIKGHLENASEVAQLAKQMRVAMDDVLKVFEENGTKEEKIKALDKLGKLVDENRYNINTWTSSSAMKMYHDYYAILDKAEEDKPEVGFIEAIVLPSEDKKTSEKEVDNEDKLAVINNENSETNTDKTEKKVESSEEKKPVEKELAKEENPVVINNKNNEVKTEDMAKKIESNTVNEEKKVQKPVEKELVKADNIIIKSKESNKIKSKEVVKTKVNNNDEKKTNSNNPKTGDISMIGYIGVGIASIAGLVLNKIK